LQSLGLRLLQKRSGGQAQVKTVPSPLHSRQELAAVLLGDFLRHRQPSRCRAPWW